MHYRAFLEGAWRVVLSQREVRRGKNKGKIEVTYRSTATIIRKAIIKPEGLSEIHNG